MNLPVFFISHGAPNLILDENNNTAKYLKESEVFSKLKPKNILIVSAHWEAETLSITGSNKPELIYDFHGFQEELYEVKYPVSGDKELANKVNKLLKDNNYHSKVDEGRGLDHGVWVPLKLIFPEANIPIVQLSLKSHQSPKYHYDLGKIFRNLSDKTLIIGSGSATHNLREIKSFNHNSETPKWVSSFADWLEQKIAEGDIDSLLDYRKLAPYAAKNHPTEDHILPLFFALGAAGFPEKKIERIHASYNFGVLAMDIYSSV